jgi:endoglucanase
MKYRKVFIASLALVFSNHIYAQTPNPHYVTLLNDSMWFYEAQRSGKLPANNNVPWYGV